MADGGLLIWVMDQQSGVVADSLYKLKADNSLDPSFGQGGRIDGINAAYNSALERNAQHHKHS